MDQKLFQNLEHEIHIWWSILDQPAGLVNSYKHMLSNAEQKRINNLKFRLLRDRQIVSKSILRQVISKYLNIDNEAIEFRYNKFGKPLLSSKLEDFKLNFNISHSEQIGIFAFAKGKSIGVDVEKIKCSLKIEDVIELCLSDFEKNWFYEVAPEIRKEVFYKIWTAKEAFIKALGTGFFFPVKNIDFKLNGDNDLTFHSISGDCNYVRKWEIFSFNPLPGFISSLVFEANDFKEIMVDRKITPNADAGKLLSCSDLEESVWFQVINSDEKVLLADKEMSHL